MYYIIFQSDQFQEDLYPDTIGTCPALSARDWISGMNNPPILISLKTGLIFFKLILYYVYRIFHSKIRYLKNVSDKNLSLRFRAYNDNIFMWLI